MTALDLTTYSGLQTAIAAWLNRSDLVDDITAFITLGESVIKRELRRKTVRAQITVTTESTALPADCSQLRSIYPVSGTPYRDVPLTIGTPEQVAEMRAMTNGVVSRPGIAAVIDGNLVVAPAPDQSYTYEITYYQSLVPLSGSVASNVVLAEAPDIYLYAALAESAPFLQHDERIPVWESERDARIASLNEKRQLEEMAGSLKQARLPIVF
jgi:hypothetical protein